MNKIHDMPPSYGSEDPPIYSPITCQPSTNPVIYHINRQSSLGDYQIQSENNKLAFSVEGRSRNITKPDMTIYRGDRNFGHRIAECTYGENSSSSRCDTGWLRQTQPSQRLGGKMSVAWWTRSIQNSATQYRFAAMIPSNTIGESLELKVPRTFAWMKSSSLTLVDEETGSVAAVCANHGFSEGDSLEITASYGSEFPLIALSTYLVLLEKEGCHRQCPAESPDANLGEKLGDFVRALKRR